MEYYNLRKNPAYLYLKGSRVLEFSNTCVHVADIFEGIGNVYTFLRNYIQRQKKEKKDRGYTFNI